ncbi:MAG TPA: energy transducer TonB [Longimicrobium sp.]|jgi:outer membrane biosynthesis protein TonB
MITRLGITHVKWLLCIILVAAACTEAHPGDARDTPLDPSPSTAGRRALSPEVQAHTGLSHLPEPVDQAELAARLRKHYPGELRAQGVSGSALLDVHVDAQGNVGEVDIVSRPIGPEHPTHRAVLQEQGGTRVLELNDRPEFGAAAQAALRETRFQPALKNGKAVPYKLRMTVQFDPQTP